MTTNPGPNKYIFDPESSEEMVRLINLDRMTTKSMGGPLAGVANPSKLSTVLDIGCGPGGWVLDVAFANPDAEVAGIDISCIMVDYANARARSEGLRNASFGVMDINQPLDFADGSFDLVNARFLFSVLKRESWVPFVAECTRLLCPGGILRLTEMTDFVTTSPAHMRLSGLFHQVIHRRGYGFSTDGRGVGVTSVLPRLLRKTGYRDVRHIPFALEFSEDTDSWADGYRNAEIIGLGFKKLIVQEGLATQEEVERWYKEMLIELHASDFCAMQHHMTIIGTKP